MKKFSTKFRLIKRGVAVLESIKEIKNELGLRKGWLL